jgi:hypothetical protein
MSKLRRLIVLERSSSAYGDERALEHRKLRGWWQSLTQAQRDRVLKELKVDERQGRRA